MCRGCGRPQPIEAFYVDRGYPISRCKTCISAERKADYAANIEDRRAAIRRRQLQRDYGITPEDYETLLDRQGGRCAICGGTGGMGHMLWPLVVDHDHNTGQVRGLLCSTCNSGLGWFRDNPDRLLAAAAYLLSRSDVLGPIAGDV